MGRELNFACQLARVTHATNDPNNTTAATTRTRLTNTGVSGFPKNARYDNPVPGSPTEKYFLPLESTPTRKSGSPHAATNARLT